MQYTNIFREKSWDQNILKYIMILITYRTFQTERHMQCIFFINWSLEWFNFTVFFFYIIIMFLIQQLNINRYQ